MNEQERVVLQVVVPMDFTYNNRVGPYVERFIKSLGEKRIMGVKCPDCGRVLVPPSKVCGPCNKILEEWVEVGPEGTVENFTIDHVRLNKGLVEKLDEPYVVAMIKLDGTSTLLPGIIKGIEPVEVRRGLKVKAVFKEPPEDSLSDLEHFEPAG